MRLNKAFTLNRTIYLVIFVIGSWQFGSGMYIYAKSHYAQFLMENAWSKTINGQGYVKPWSWADTHPIAKISFLEHKKNYIVLAGGSERTMAFGPGHISATSMPGKHGNSVLVGHRDTHFSILKELEIGNVIDIQNSDSLVRYEVVNSFIVDRSQTEVMNDYGIKLLTLITCYPFDDLHAGNFQVFVTNS